MTPDSQEDTGSSPHTRGARWSAARDSDIRGIIPAYAGSTEIDNTESRLCRDHPRIRGEHMEPVPTIFCT